MGKAKLISMPPDSEIMANVDNYRKIGIESLSDFLWVISSASLVDEIRLRNRSSKGLSPRSDYTAFNLKAVAD